MNNKGFAVTTLIYGLSIMGIMIVMVILGTISVSRRNIRDISNQVEQDLLNYGEKNVVYRGVSSGSSNTHEYEILEDETGFYRIEVWGGGSGTTIGGKGAYTTGIVYLEKGDKLQLVPGYNGGESIVKYGSNDDSPIIMKASGANGNIDGGTLCSYKNSNVNPSNGKLDEDFNSVSEFINGSQYLSINFIGERMCTFSNNTGSKSDYYSYISGYEDIKTESSKIFFDTLMLPGVNEKQEGIISIRNISSADSINEIVSHMNDNYKDVSSIEVVHNKIDDMLFQTPCYLMLSYYKNGSFGFEKWQIDNENPTQFNLDHVNVSDVSFICTNSNDNDFINLDSDVSISLDGNNIYNGHYMFPSPTGIKLSAFQPDSNHTVYFPDHGNYYILPVNSENNVVTGPNSDGLANPVNIDYLNGSNNQKWSIDTHDVNKFKIINLGTYRALDVMYAEKYQGRELTTESTFNMMNFRDEQQWIISGNDDNTFSLKTALTNGNDDVGGYILADTRSVGGTGNLMIGPGKDNPSVVERFRFYSIDFIK